MVKYNEEALIGVYWTEGMRETRGNGEILRLFWCFEKNFRWSPQILDFQSFRTFGGNWEGSLVFALCSFHEPRNPHQCLNKGKRSSMSSFPPWSFRSGLFTFLPLSKQTLPSAASTVHPQNSSLSKPLKYRTILSAYHHSPTKQSNRFIDFQFNLK